MADYSKPLPLIDEESKPFWDAAKQHQFVLHHCKNCGTYYYPASYCRKCATLAHMEWAPASGKGTLYTYIIMHQVYQPGFKGEVPYNVSIVELEEGPFILTNIINCKNEDLKIGMPVQVVFDDATEEVSLPKFKPAG